MANNKISYTERDFLGIRNELVRLTNKYYPDLFSNANDASMYSVFLTSVLKALAAPSNLFATSWDLATLENAILDNIFTQIIFTMPT